MRWYQNSILRMLAAGACLVASVNVPLQGQSPAKNNPPPRIVFEKPVHDFGKMDQGGDTTCEFVFHNKGQGTLVLQDVISSCGCAGALPSAREIPPGGDGKVLVTFRSGGVSGSIEKMLTVRSNDPVHPAVTLAIRADVQPIYILEPPITSIGEIPRGKGAVREVVVRDSKRRPFKIHGVVVSHPDLKAEVFPVEGSDGSAHRLKLTVNAKRNAGPFNFSVIPQTDRLNVPHPMILVSGFVAGPVRAWPPALYLGTIRVDQQFQPKTVLVTNSGPAMVEILAVDSGDPAIHASVRTNTPGKEFKIELKVDKMPIGWFQRNMQIRTSESDVPLEVSLSGVVMKSTTQKTP